MSAKPSDLWILRGWWTGGESEWQPGDGGTSPAAAAWGMVASFRTERSGPWSLDVNTTEFFEPDGRKKGFGSSAAATLLYTAGLAALFRCREEGDFDLLQTAIDAHRFVQKGVGSGYDVAASFHGGAGLFTGGERPGWTLSTWPGNIEGGILSGPKEVATTGAVETYRRWRASHPGESGLYRRENDTGVRGLVNAAADGDPEGFLREYRHLRDAGVALGAAIGVDARPRFPSNWPVEMQYDTPGITFVVKSLGAGNETLLLLYRAGEPMGYEREILIRSSTRGALRPLSVDPRGLEGWPDGTASG